MKGCISYTFFQHDTLFADKTANRMLESKEKLSR